MIDGVIRNRIAPADLARQERVCLHEVAGEEERSGDALALQHRENLPGSVRVAATVERQRDDMLPCLQPDELARNDRRRQSVNHASPGRRRPAARVRKAGTGSAVGCATSSTAP